MRANIPKLKEALPLPALMRQLGLEHHAKRSALCPFHEDASPSFSVYQTASGWRFTCHAACGGGDEIDFLQKHRRLDRGGAIRLYEELAGKYRYLPQRRQEYPGKPQEKPAVQFPPDMHLGTRAELETVSRLRKVDFWSVATLQNNQVLRFGTVCGEACWIVTDVSGRIAEARCMSGRQFPAFRGLGERKAHTLRGASKGWPVGLLLPAGLHESFERVMLCEGAGDLLAAYHFALEEGGIGLTWQPVAMLGAGARLHPDALALLRKKRVKIIPHADKAGLEGAHHWARVLSEAGCAVGLFDLDGLRKKDGSRVKDLNDCTDLDDADRDGLEGLWV
jgi:hypothetical protein